MKILIMDWPAFGQKNIKRVLKQMGIETECFDFPYQSAGIRDGEELGTAIASTLLSSGADAVFSFNFFPLVAAAAHACRKKYISWVYDSPAIQLYSMMVFLPESYIFHFDSSEVQRMRAEGVEHVYYLPLAADVEAYDAMIPNAEQKKKYAADIAMIGSMYSEERYQIFRKYENFDPYLKGYLEAVLRAQGLVYGVDLLTPAMTEDIMEMVRKQVPLEKESADSYETPAWIFANYYLAKQLTARDREGLLAALSEHYDTVVYTLEETPGLKKVKNRGRLDYYTQAPLAMKCARINLNSSLRSIHSGIPLRAMDIMACGGFLLSNYQADLAMDFVPGEEFVYYESIEDAVEKAGYYLEHEEERSSIARKGYEKAAAMYSYRNALQLMLQAAGLLAEEEDGRC